MPLLRLCDDRHVRARRLVASALLVSAASLVLAACGSSSSAGSHHAAGLTATSVASVRTNVTAQMVEAASTRSARSHEAEFTLTATDRAGRPAVDQPVNFWIGPMFPHCDDQIRAWYEVGGSYARRFVAGVSTRTNARGQATLKLLGQTPRTMEMVALRVGNLSSFSDGHGNGLLDVWWTKAGASPTAPVGDRVTVAPFLTAQALKSDTYRVHVSDGGGHAVQGARVSLKANVMGSTGTPVLRRTDGSGETTFDYPRGAQGTLRVKVYEPSSGALFSGAMTADTVQLG